MGGRKDGSGEPEVAVAAATPDSLDTGIERVQRWTLPMLASNEPRRSKAVFFVFLALVKCGLRPRWAWVKVLGGFGVLHGFKVGLREREPS